MVLERVYSVALALLSRSWNSLWPSSNLRLLLLAHYPLLFLIV